jgi:AcrR family transcriptional regulator
MKQARAYTQRLRARQVTENEQRVLDAAEELFGELPFDRVSLAAIAERARVSVPTVQRRFGSKEGVFEAAGTRVRARVVRQRGQPREGNFPDALRRLVEHYEADGDVTWHLLRQEADLPPLGGMLDRARSLHRAWVERVFSRAIGRRTAEARRHRVDGLVAATDLFVWKLLRRDLGRSRSETRKVMLDMALAIARTRT